MDKWIEIYRKGDVYIHRLNNKIIIQEGPLITMKVYMSENDAIFASLGVLLLYSKTENTDK